MQRLHAVQWIYYIEDLGQLLTAPELQRSIHGSTHLNLLLFSAFLESPPTQLPHGGLFL